MAKADFFHSKDGILLAAMCFQTYRLFLAGIAVLPKGFEHRYTIRAVGGVMKRRKEVFGFVAESKDAIVVAFRGTGSLQDFESDADFFQVPFPYVKQGGKTHRGVTHIYQSARNELIQTVKNLPARKKLWITGHSLGGALATLFALDVAANTRFKHPRLVTFASFRVGDPAFASRFNQTVKNSVRIVNVHDPIPLAFVKSVYPPPFTQNGLYYRHVERAMPLSFQLNHMLRNHAIRCYFNHLSQKNPAYAQTLCKENPGLCPNTGKCGAFNEMT